MASVAQAVRPYLWLALLAFLVGFLSYAAIGGAHAPVRSEPQFSPRVSAPTTEDWNFPKHI